MVVITSGNDGSFGKDSSSGTVDFTNYKSKNLKLSKIKNGDISRVIRMRDLHVATSLGYKLILKNMRHVLSLKVNLLSLSKLDKLVRVLDFLKAHGSYLREHLSLPKGKNMASYT